MERAHGRFSAGNARTAVIVVLLSLVALFASPSAVKMAPLVVMLVASIGVVVCSVAWMVGRSGSRAVGGVAVASAVGLVGAVLYLRSLADDSSAIPLAGVGVLLLSVIGLVVSAVLLRDARR
jgi:sugar phosphate permease